MDFSEQDEAYLGRALRLARESSAFASPNPTVGCVLARDGRIIGEGAHRYAAFDHAEVVALHAAAAGGEVVRGSTSYVTLEPCSYHGRTGPCADALIRAGIGRCVVATVDPNLRVRGAGIEKMRAAGIDTLVVDAAAAIAQSARRLNDPFAFSIQRERPFVTLKAAISADGKIAPAPGTRSSRAPVWLTGQAARADVQRLRLSSDAILTGIGTVLADDPSLSDRSGLPRGRRLLRVVLDSHLRLPLDAKLLHDADDDVLVIGALRADDAQATALASRGAEVIRLAANDDDGLDLSAVLDVLYARGMRSVLLEGGSRLNAAWLQARLVDRVALYSADVVLGEDAIPFAANFPSLETVRQSMRVIQRTTFARDDHAGNDDVYVEGLLHDPWTGV